jgi:transposase
MNQFYDWLGEKKAKSIRLAVMDMWKPFRNATNNRAPQAAILFDKFHIMRHLGEALDKVRKSEYARLAGSERRYIKGQKYVLLSNHENLTLDGRKSLKALLAANKRLKYCLPAEGIVRPVVELPAGRMGAAFLRKLEVRPEVAAPETIREIR